MGSKGSEICINKHLDMRLNRLAADEPAKEMQKDMTKAKQNKVVWRK